MNNEIPADPAFARLDDPATSWDAYGLVKVSRHMYLILRAARDIQAANPNGPGLFTDQQLTDQVNRHGLIATPQSVRSRRADACRKHWITQVDREGTSPTGGRAMRFTITQHGRAVLATVEAKELQNAYLKAHKARKNAA